MPNKVLQSWIEDSLSSNKVYRTQNLGHFFEWPDPTWTLANKNLKKTAKTGSLNWLVGKKPKLNLGQNPMTKAQPTPWKSGPTQYYVSE